MFGTFNSRLVLPLMIFFGVLILGLRIEDVWTTATTGQFTNGTPAHAETKAEAPAATPNPAEATKTNVPEAPPPLADDDSSPAEQEVLKQLAGRRDQLDKRGHELDTRESLIKVAEQRVDQKIQEMEKLRVQLQSMVNQVGGAQAAQTENLVKIYETMKPKEAARIFETLDMPVLLGVIQRMKPARTAPIMAEMAPEKAKEVTVALTKQDQLPQVK
jgi:flagellar motility protein MotE (MotC chaperone)